MDMSVTLIAICSINLRRCMMILRTMRPEDSSVLMIFCARELLLTLSKVIHIKDNYIFMDTLITLNKHLVEVCQMGILAFLGGQFLTIRQFFMTYDGLLQGVSI